MVTRIRRVVMVVALASALLGAGSSVARADVIGLGYIAFDMLIPGENPLPGVAQFTVVNLTGDPAAGGFALPPDFPVVSPLTFQSASVTLTFTDFTTSTTPLGDLGPGPTLFGAFVIPGSLSLFSALFEASIAPATFQAADGTTFAAPPGRLVADLQPSDGASLQEGDLAVIAVDASPVPVPEPATLLLLGTGATALAGLTRRNGRRRR